MLTQFSKDRVMYTFWSETLTSSDIYRIKIKNIALLFVVVVFFFFFFVFFLLFSFTVIVV